MKRALLLLSLMLIGLLTASFTAAQTGTFNANGTFSVSAPTQSGSSTVKLTKSDRDRLDNVTAALTGVSAQLDSIGVKMDRQVTAQDRFLSQLPISRTLKQQLEELPWLGWLVAVLIIAMILLIIYLLVSLFRPRTVETKVVVSHERIPVKTDPTPAPPTFEKGQKVKILRDGEIGQVAESKDSNGLVVVMIRENVERRERPEDLEVVQEEKVNATPPPAPAAPDAPPTSGPSTRECLSEDDIVVRVPSSRKNAVIIVACGDGAEPLFKQVVNFTPPAPKPSAPKEPSPAPGKRPEQRPRDRSRQPKSAGGKS